MHTQMPCRHAHAMQRRACVVESGDLLPIKVIIVLQVEILAQRPVRKLVKQDLPLRPPPATVGGLRNQLMPPRPSRSTEEGAGKGWGGAGCGGAHRRSLWAPGVRRR